MNTNAERAPQGPLSFTRSPATYDEQIAYTVTGMLVAKVAVHPVAGVVADPPTGADTRRSLLPVVAVVEKPPPVAYG
jgi:hypothetical protein